MTIDVITVIGSVVAASLSLLTFYSQRKAKETFRLANEKDIHAEEKGIIVSASQKLDELKIEMAQLESLIERESLSRKT